MPKSCNISRRALLGSVGAGTGLLAIGSVPRAQESRKYTKEEAEYKDVTEDFYLCAACSLFLDPGSCSIVDGKISPRGTCKYFAHVE